MLAHVQSTTTNTGLISSKANNTDSTALMDRFSFVAPARVKVLVLPLGGLGREQFERYFDQIRATFDIRLLDVSPIPECKYFNPQAFPQGRILYDYSSSLPEEETKFLHDFEPFRKTFVVIGVGEYTKDNSAVADLKEQFPTAIVNNCIFFNSPPDLLGSSEPETFHLNALANLNITDVETTICGVTKNYLMALDEYASSYENITLRSPVSLVDSNVLTRTINYAQKRLSSGSAFKVSFSNGQDVVKSADLKIRALQRQSGRHSKLMGNFFLLAGRCNDALQYFTDAAINCKKCDDYLWLASALEGLAVSSFLLSDLGLPYHVQNPMLASVLQISRNRLLTLGNSSHRMSTDSVSSRLASNIVSPRNSTSSSLGFGISSATLSGAVPDLSSMPLPEFLRLLSSKASQYYQLSASEIEDCVPDLVYVESLIRSIKLMITIYLVGSGPLESIFNSVIKSTPIVLAGARDGSHVSKGDIILEIDKVFSLQLVDLDFAEQCRVYCALASIYSDLKLYRKQAFILRILLVALLPEVDRVESGQSMGLRSSIAGIFLLLFKVYRIDIEPESSASLAKDHISDWSTLQILLIKICLRIAEAQHDYVTLAKLCVLTFTRYLHCLLAEDQIKLRNKLNWLNLWLGDNNKNTLPYPDPFLVRKIKYVVAPSGSDLVPFADAEQETGSLGNDSAIIFDPFSKSKVSANKEKIICVDEVHQIKVTMQNPFPYEVEVRDVSIVSVGDVKVETIKNLVKKVSSTPLATLSDNNSININAWGTQPRKAVPTNGVVQPSSPGCVILPANNTSQLVVSFKALNVGLLTMRGLSLKVGNSKTQTFLVSESEVSSGLQKIKHFGPQLPSDDDNALDKLIDILSTSDITKRVTTLELTLNVIARQPSLSLIKNLVTNGWLMLLEGERLRFSLELKNTSSEPVNYLSFSFWDSASDSINSNLSQPGAYSAEDIYELEWLLIKNKPFSVLNKQEIALQHKVINPNDDFKIDYEVYGKRGMTELKLILEYSNKSAGSSGKSFVKTVSVPLNVTTQPSLEVVGCDIIPVFSTTLLGQTDDFQQKSGINQRNMDALLAFIANTNLSVDNEIDAYALLVLDVKNSWKQRLAVKICNNIASGDDYVVKETLDPFETYRFIVPVKRIGHDVVDTSKPIPSLRNKQFIKNYNISEHDEAQERRNFWIKSILLEGLSGEWSSVGLANERCGYLDMRCIRLSLQMTNVLVYDKVLVQQWILADDGSNEEIAKENHEYRLQREKFYILKTKITNHSSEGLTGVLRHIPFPINATTKQDLSIEQKILFNGLLQRHVGEDFIEQGLSFEVSLGFMVLEKGRYEWGCVFDVAGDKRIKTICREPVFINAL